MPFDQTSALRLATLRAQNSLTDQEQEEVIKLEMAYSTYLREEDPDFQLPLVTMTANNNTTSAPSSQNQTNNGTSTVPAVSNGKEATKKNSGLSNASDEYDVMEHTSSSSENGGCAAGAATANNGEGGYGSYFSGLSNYLPSKESLDTAARATWFYTSLTVGTGAPGFVGKKLGLTDGFDYWNWILLPITSQTADISPNQNVTEANQNQNQNTNENKNGSKNLLPQGGLILGALPILTEVMGSGNHLKALHKEMRQFATSMGMVVSALTEQELNGFGVGPQFANHDSWREEFGKDNMSCKLLEVEDCTPDGFVFDKLEEVLQEMDETMMKKGKCVYVHCAKGKGRSWVVVMCYLIAYKNMTMDAAATLVKAKRHQVNPSKSQVGFVQEFYQRTMRKQAEKTLQS